MLIEQKFNYKFETVAIGLVVAAALLLPSAASAVTAVVAKKCNLLVAKEFPPRQVGNPAAGSSKGSVKDQRDYFNKCVANGGNMDSSADKNDKK